MRQFFLLLLACLEIGRRNQCQMRFMKCDKEMKNLSTCETCCIHSSWQSVSVGKISGTRHRYFYDMKAFGVRTWARVLLSTIQSLLWSLWMDGKHTLETILIEWTKFVHNFVKIREFWRFSLFLTVFPGFTDISLSFTWSSSKFREIYQNWLSLMDENVGQRRVNIAMGSCLSIIV